jgi:hypothetical protein
MFIPGTHFDDDYLPLAGWWRARMRLDPKEQLESDLGVIVPWLPRLHMRAWARIVAAARRGVSDDLIRREEAVRVLAAMEPNRVGASCCEDRAKATLDQAIEEIRNLGKP